MSLLLNHSLVWENISFPCVFYHDSCAVFFPVSRKFESVVAMTLGLSIVSEFIDSFIITCEQLLGSEFWRFGGVICRLNCSYGFQVEASTNQVAEQHMQLYNLPWKILCEVMNVELKVLKPPLVANVTSAFQPIRVLD